MHRAEPLPRPVGRDAEVEYAASLLGADPAGHLRVSAGPGMGSSSFARFVATTTGRPVRWVRADPVSRCIPLGVLAALVSSPAEPLGAGPDMLVRAVARLVPDPACPPVVVVDGAEHLDDSSALVLAQAADAGATLVLTTARATPLPAALAAFVRAAAVGEVLLGPLDDGAVASLAADVLGAPVDPALIRAVTRLVGGAPAAIVDVLEHARRDRTVVPTGSAWRLAGAVALPPAARARVDDLVERLRADETEAVDLLALAGTAPRASVAALVGPDALDSLDLRCLLEHLPQQRLRLVDPLLRAARLDRLPPGARQRLAQAFRRSAPVSSGVDPALDAALAVHAGDPLDPDTMVRAARHALHQGEPDVAELLSRHALVADGSTEAAILLGEVLTVLGRSHEAEQLLADLTVSRPDDLALAVQTRAVNLAYHLDDVDGALGLIGQALDAVAGTAWGAELVGLRGVITMMSGHPGDALTAVQPLLRSEQGRPFCEAATAAGPALVMLGRHLDAADLAARSFGERQGLGDQPMLASAGLHALVRSFGLAEAGHFAEADAICSEVMAGAVRHNDREGQMWAGIIHGRSLLDQGRLDEARATFEAAATAATDVTLVPHLAWARGGALLAAAQTGDVVTTRHALLALEACPPTRLAMMAPDLLRARAWSAVTHGDLRTAASTLVDAADLAAESGELGLEVLALYDLVRLGVVDHAERLVQRAVGVQGELAEARAEHAAALVAADAPGLLAASKRLESLGALVLSAEAATHAAWTFRRSQQARQADLMHDRVARLRALRPEASTPGLDLQPGAAYLTAREREVAALAAAGLPSRRIADRLDISVRTVDNLLQRVYRKLGVTSRADLHPGGLDLTPPQVGARQGIRPAARVPRR